MNIQKIDYNGFQMSVPAEWKDDTMLVWTAPVDGNITPSVVVAHSILPEGKSFEEHITEQQKELMNTVPHFILNSKEESLHNGLPCVTVRHSWKADSARISQLQYAFLTSDKKVYTITCTHELESFENLDATFQEILKTVQYS